MKVNTATVSYSSIVKIGEDIANIEANIPGKQILKLHRGVMDVTHIDINKLGLNLDLNSKKTQQYGANNGLPELITEIKNTLHCPGDMLITPGGMAGLDLLINSIADRTFYIPEYHWGSWNKILKTHNKTIETFDDFKLEEFKPTEGVVMLCFPSNPTGYCPTLDTIKSFVDSCNPKKVTIILDLPYYWLFNDWENDMRELLFYDNVILVSSFSKSIGLSGYRVGFISTINDELFQTLKIRSLYKYNSISTIPQIIITELLKEKTIINEYRETTKSHIESNINLLDKMGLLIPEYPSLPIGPFAVVNRHHEALLGNNISSVPMSKFRLTPTYESEHLSRISVAVDTNTFVNFFKTLILF